MSGDRDSTPSSSSSSSSSSRHNPAEPSRPPPSPTSSSSGSAHPLLPPLPGHPVHGHSSRGPALLGAEIDPDAIYQAHKNRIPKSAIPEKCFTFCTQKADGIPLCRMLCLRKRPVVKSQSEELSRLRPPAIRQTHSNGHADSETLGEAHRSPGRPKEKHTWSWSPFEYMRRVLDPYSIIYVKGTMDGVVGRYMEELEADDGQHDFGAVSRGADELARKRRGENVWEYLDWEDHGSMLYLPLTSLFYPILAIPQNFNKVFSPGYRLFNEYIESFQNGVQKQNFQTFKTALQENSGGKLLSDMLAYNRRKSLEMREEIAKVQEQRKSMLEKQQKVDKEHREERMGKVEKKVD